MSRSSYYTTQVSLKLLIDEQTQKVVYAEAGKEFVDFLLTILSLPLGTVTMLLSKTNMVGCLGSMYQSIETLDDSYIIKSIHQSKDSILNPKRLYSPTTNTPLLPTVGSAVIKQFYTCSNTQQGVLALGPAPQNPRGLISPYSYGVNPTPTYRHSKVRVAEDQQAICPDCKEPMQYTVEYTDAPSSKTGGQEGGFVKGAASYMIMDNLEIKPMSTVSIMAAFNRFSIKDVGALEEKVIKVTSAEGLKILKASLTTQAVLSTVFLGP
ncbi:hypothetical protein LINPERPRIM_LOCUS4135 [Linum perenne]